MEKAIRTPLMTLVMLILIVFSPASSYAASDWTVSPADFRYDMSLYFKLSSDAVNPPVNQADYEIAAFVDDVCRGVAERLPGVDDCLYMRIRSNSPSGEQILFKARNKAGELIELSHASIIFEDGKAVGLPSDPYIMEVVEYYDVEITASEGGSVNFESGKYAGGTEIYVKAVPDEKYRFVKWSDGPTEPERTIIVKENTSLKAFFEKNVFTLTYKIGSDLYKQYDVEVGTTITPEEAPEKEGHTFSGWTGLPETMPAHDVEVTGSYSVNSYTLTYKIDGEVFKAVELSYGESVTPEEAPEKEGHTFSGWTGLPETMPAHDVEVTGSYSVNSYILTYKIDGEVFKAVELSYGESVTPEEAPEKEGHTFSGWTGLPETMPAHDVEVTGSYSVNSYILTYKIDGEVFKAVELSYGESVTPEEAPEKEGHTFSGWTGLPETMPAHDVEVTGSYSVNSYTLTYKIDGEVFKAVELSYGESVTPEEAPEKEGQTFSGWTGLPETMPAHDVEVIGSYSVNSYTLTYKIDGEVFKAVELSYGESVTPEEAPEKEGQTFSGWTGLPETMPAHDVEVTGSYSVNSYTLTYKIDGEVFKAVELSYGETVTPEEAPEKEGHTFSGWTGLPETMPAHDVEVTGSYSVNSYILTYKIDGEVFKAVELSYGESVTPEEAPEKEGHTFSGWTGLPETMPAHDVEVTGSYSVNSYTLTYKIDGEVFKAVELSYGETVTPEEAPEKEGHTFSGWTGLPETMPAHDVEVTGSYSVNSYILTYKIDGEVFKAVELSYGESVTPEEAPEKEGHTFSGWTGLPETMPAHDVEVTGSYSVNSYTLTYKIDGEVFKAVELSYGESVTPEEAPEKEGHTFSGWTGLPETMPAHDVEVTGSYSVNSYILTYKIDGEVFKAVELSYGESVTPEEAPEKEGYTFSGWTGLPETMPAHDVEVTAEYTPNLYKLTVYIDNEIYFEAELEMGDKIEIPTPEPPAGYVFDGWIEEIPETMPAHDVEIHGTTSANSGLQNIFTDENDLLTVYSLNGALLLRNVTVQQAKERLRSGIYIINGKKVKL